MAKKPRTDGRSRSSKAPARGSKAQAAPRVPRAQEPKADLDSAGDQVSLRQGAKVEAPATKAKAPGELVNLVRRYGALVGLPVAAAVGFAAASLDLGDYIQGVFDHGSQNATKKDIELIRDELSKQQGAEPPFGAQEIDSETAAMLSDALVPGSSAYQIVTQNLKHRKIGAAVTALRGFSKADLQATPSRRNEATDKLYLAGLLQMRGDFDDAAKLLEEALTISPERDEIRAMLAIVRINQDNMKGASLLLQDIDGPETVKDYLVSNVVGLIALKHRDFQKAAAYFQRSLILSQAAGAKAPQAAALGNLGNVHYLQGEFDRSDAYYKLSIEVNSGENVRLDGNQYCNLGSNALQKNRMEEAKAYYKLAVDIFDYANDKTCLPNALTGLGISALNDEEFQQAEAYFARAKFVALKQGQIEGRLIASLNLSQALEIQGDTRFEDELIDALRVSLRRIGTTGHANYNRIVGRIFLPEGKIRTEKTRRRALQLLVGANKANDTRSDQAVQLALVTAISAVAVGDCENYARFGRMVVDEALRRKDATLLVVFGDGIVEARERYGARCSGVRVWPKSFER